MLLTSRPTDRRRGREGERRGGGGVERGERGRKINREERWRAAAVKPALTHTLTHTHTDSTHMHTHPHTQT